MQSPSPGQLQIQIQNLFRNFGVLNESTTPCGLKIKPSQAHCMLLLLGASRDLKILSQQHLAEGVGINKSNVARLCTRMLAKGLITQMKNSADGRQFDISLTPKGQRMAEKIEASSHARFRELLQKIPPSVQQDVLNSLRLLNEAVLKL